MCMMKRLALTALAGVALAGAFVANEVQEVKAGEITIGFPVEEYVPDTPEQAVKRAKAAKEALLETLEKRHFEYVYLGVDLVELYGGYLEPFEQDYRDYRYSGNENLLSEADFYKQIHLNLILNPHIKGININHPKINGEYVEKDGHFVTDYSDKQFVFAGTGFEFED